MAVEVAVPAERAWAAVADWESQRAWMVATRVRGVAAAAGGAASGTARGPASDASPAEVASAASGVGGRIEGWTGIGPVGFLDTMTITEWDPPHRCVVLHTGRVVRGTGGFEVAPRSGGCRVTWWERVELPFGVVGRAGWLVLGPVTRAFFVLSLRRLKRLLEAS